MGQEQQKQQKRVLAVDNDLGMVRLVIDVVEDLGYPVEGHINPQHALDSFRNNPGEFGLVVTDRDMPGMNGLTLIKRIQEFRKDSGIAGALPSIMLSGGKFTPEAIAELEKYGVTLLRKPLPEIEVLEHAVTQALDR